MNHIYTDLAVESREIYSKGKDIEVEGVAVKVEEQENYTITLVEVLNDEGSKKIGKPIGKYITLHSPNLDNADEDLKDEMSLVLGKEFKGLIKDYKADKVLIIGLGNWDISSDSLGPKVIERVLVTRQYFINFNKEFDESMANVAAVSPGVMGTTGIETFDIVKGIVEKIKPDIVIAVDALSSRKMDRISTTIQLSNIGINPGSGIGNKRKGLTEKTLGVPVFAIGIPTVVNAATMVNDTMDLIIDSMKQTEGVGREFYNLLDDLSKEDKYSLIDEVLSPFMGNVIVTPKDIDVIIEDLSIIIANGLNIAVHPGIDLKDVNRYIR
ncbi:GPR endopeptidase [Tissierella creatinophila]|uniref:Germination protease n=1 Tax=Tissierella creatinophila DSM 6911 TaxID=1123403 RepID=A0A1U7M7Y7_TISCR|nr:GPR endopeptidase [Tissierella creatinophila]OLS03395.1 germination protease precursor [Tissierella creatinophila DSM 6911]